jgi:predicted  nucleic acid-binding Zn-ribbon protein
MVLEQYIQRVEEKLHLLVKKLQQVQGENALLKEEVSIQQKELQQQQQAVQGLEERLQLMKIAATAQGGTTIAAEDEAFKKEIRGKINDYIKEIDRCIALLNS